MGCACATQAKGVGPPAHLGQPSNPRRGAGPSRLPVRDRQRRDEYDSDDDRYTPVIAPPQTLQYLVQCNHCDARLELCVPPDTAPGIRIETECAGCSRLLQVRLSHGAGRRGRSFAEAHPVPNHNLLNRGFRGRGDYYDNAAEQKAIKENLEQRKRASIVNDLPREIYDERTHKDLTECEFCLQDYVNGDELIRLPCMHAFHASCAAPWLRKAGTCPVCQIDICKACGNNGGSSRDGGSRSYGGA